MSEEVSLTELQRRIERIEGSLLPNGHAQAIAAAADALIRSGGGVVDVIPMNGGGWRISAPLLVDCETTATLLPGNHHPRTIRRIAEDLGTLVYVGKTPGINPRALVTELRGGRPQ